MANRSAAIAYHTSNMRDLRAAACDRRERARAVGNLPPNQEEEKHAEHEIEAAESHERKEHGAGVNAGARPLRGPEETVDEPGLAAQLGGHPSGGVRDVWERKREQQDPQHGPIALETSPPPGTAATNPVAEGVVPGPAQEWEAEE